MCVYTDAAFGCLGLLTFVQTRQSSLTYAASVGPILLMNVFRGSQWWLKHRWRSKAIMSRRNQRVRILVESLSAVISRVAAYAIYFCSAAMTFAWGKQEIITRHSLLGGQEQTLVTINIFSNEDVSIDHVYECIAGSTITLLCFCSFCFFLPYAWSSAVKVHPGVEGDVPEVPEMSSQDPYEVRTGSQTGEFEEDQTDETLPVFELLFAFLWLHFAQISYIAAFVLMMCTATACLAQSLRVQLC
eukprot:TRINITY_DN5134_c0_g1_i4.p1 TRINITY_DN5134_c0_g1~~TRINITY_DN5134_c0_g1_i4.p1  ORF type:complete len:244 (+),score=22.79 TRINITY_DN5134_c0_g1_i4:561-1292(+)